MPMMMPAGGVVLKKTTRGSPAKPNDPNDKSAAATKSPQGSGSGSGAGNTFGVTLRKAGAGLK